VWINNVVLGSPQMAIRRMRFACWMPKATFTFSEYVILVSFPQQRWLHERAPMWRYTHTACLAVIFCTIGIFFIRSVLLSLCVPKTLKPTQIALLVCTLRTHYHGTKKNLYPRKRACRRIVTTQHGMSCMYNLSVSA